MKGWPSEWTDEEFQRRAAALDTALDRHLGKGPRTIDALDAEYVMMALWLGSAGTGAMNAGRERAQLIKVERLAQELAEAWHGLHIDVRTRMELLSTMIHEANGRYCSFRSRDPLSLDIVGVLDGLLSMVAPSANQVIDNAPASGRRNLTNAAIVDRLRQVWKQRKGVEAPRSMTEAGPFADFIIEAFETLGIEANPRAAVDSWREFRVALLNDG